MSVASSSRFLRACRRQTVDATPVWFMRQAGRALPEYRAIRERFSLIEIAQNPELCAEVTLQPLRLLGVDAAILFSDITTPLIATGVGLEIVESVGPVVERPIRAESDLAVLRPLEPDEDLPYVARAIRLLKAELGATPLIGFAGAPFTLASYLIEGKPSRTFLATKTLMYRSPDLWNEVMRRLTDLTIAYLRVQALAGADALQLFDSWVGCLSPGDYAAYVQPHTRRIFAALWELPTATIHFGTDTATLLPLLKDDGADVIGVDWRVPLDVAWAEIGSDRAIQGNLDPAQLFGDWQTVERAAADVLRRAAGRPGHIFNLGHGVHPGTPVDHLRPSLRKEMSMRPSEAPRGVLLMAYGTPRDLDEVEPYYTHIRGGRTPSPAALENLRARYQAVGGKTPLYERTRDVAEGLQARLDRDAPGRYRVFFGMKHWHPFIGEVVPKMAEAGVGEAVAIALAPHYSRMSVGTYREYVENTVATLPTPIQFDFVDRWHAQPLFRRLIADRMHAALDRFPAEARDDVTVVFSAHSLPRRILAWNDPYPDELNQSAAGVAELAGVKDWRFAFQSAGMTPEPWLGPDLLDALDALATEGKRNVLSVPFGFVADHLEILYDIDVEAQARARERGLHLERIALPNADPEFVDVLASIVVK